MNTDQLQRQLPSTDFTLRQAQGRQMTQIQTATATAGSPRRKGAKGAKNCNCQVAADLREGARINCKCERPRAGKRADQRGAEPLPGTPGGVHPLALRAVPLHPVEGDMRRKPSPLGGEGLGGDATQPHPSRLAASTPPRWATPPRHARGAPPLPAKQGGEPQRPPRIGGGLIPPAPFSKGEGGVLPGPGPCDPSPLEKGGHAAGVTGMRPRATSPRHA
jgi:hypothetical protein